MIAWQKLWIDNYGIFDRIDVFLSILSFMFTLDSVATGGGVSVVDKHMLFYVDL